MTELPDWLSPMVSVNPWTQDTFGTLYNVFQRDFKDSQPLFNGHTVWFFPDIEDGKEVIFWHLTHRYDRVTDERLPDLRRCERLPWVRSMIDNSKEPELLTWDNREGKGAVRTYLWLKDHNFLVLMKRYSDGARRLITSYYIDYPHKQRKLEKKYMKRIQ